MSLLNLNGFLTALTPPNCRSEKSIAVSYGLKASGLRGSISLKNSPLLAIELILLMGGVNVKHRYCSSVTSQGML